MIQKDDTVEFRTKKSILQYGTFKVVATFSSCCNRWCTIKDTHNGLRTERVDTDDLQIVYPWWHIRRYFK